MCRDNASEETNLAPSLDSLNIMSAVRALVDSAYVEDALATKFATIGSAVAIERLK
jgi:hypothetical protein